MEKFIKNEKGEWVDNPALDRNFTSDAPVKIDPTETGPAFPTVVVFPAVSVNPDGNIVPGAVSKEEIDKKAELEKIKLQNQEDLRKLQKENTETVNVNKAALDSMVKRLERLEYSADKGRLGKFDERNKEEVKKIVMLGVYSGQVVLGWKMLKDEVTKVNGIWRESQLLQIKLENETTFDLPYLQYIQEVAKVAATIISRTKESGGHETLKVQRNDNGKEYSIDITFINP